MPIKIKDKNWNILKEIEIDFSKTLLEQIRNSWVEIHSACNIWICAACMCKIEKWWEYLVKNFRWEPGFPLWEKEIMTCIWWVKKDNYDIEPEIILKTIY